MLHYMVNMLIFKSSLFQKAPDNYTFIVLPKCYQLHSLRIVFQREGNCS